MGSAVLVGVALIMFAGSIPAALALFTSTFSTGGNTFTADVLQPPTGLGAASTGSNSASLSWTPSASVYAVGYNLRRSKTQGSGYTQVGSVAGGGSTSYPDTGLQPGTTYYYVGQSYYQNWTSANSNEASTTTAGTTSQLLGGWLTGLSHAVEAGSNRGLVFIAGNEQQGLAAPQVELLGTWGTGLTAAAQAGSNRVLVFIAGNEQGSGSVTLSSVSYGGQALTKVNEVTVGSSTTAYVSIWILTEAGLAAASSTAFTVNWSATPNNPMYAHAFFGNVDQATPTGAQATNSSAGATPNPITTAALATANRDLVVTGAVAGNSGSYTPQNGFTLGNNQTAATTTTLGTAHKSATGANETPSMLHSNPNRQVIAATVLNVVAPPVSPTISSVTYGGQALTKVNEVTVGSSTTAYVSIWFLDEAGIAAASGSTLAVNWSSSPGFPMYSHAFFGGLDQDAPLGAQATNSSAGATPNPITTAALATGNGDMVVTGAVSGNDGSYTPQNGFTLGNNQNAGGTTTLGTAHKVAVAGTETPSMQHSNANRQVIAGVVLKKGSVKLANFWTTGLTHAAGSGKDRLLVFVAGMENDGDRDLTSVMYGGQPLTQAGEVVIGTANNFRARTELWYLAEAGIQAATGTTFSVTWSGTASSFDSLYSAVTLTNVDQADAVGNTSGGSTTIANPIQTATPAGVGVGDIVIASAVSGNAGSYTPSAAYTEGADLAGASSTMGIAYRQIAADGTEQPSMQYDAAINRQVILAATLKVKR